MKSYKVEIEQTRTYVFDVQAESTEEAEEIARTEFDKAEETGVLHYHENKDSVENSNIYDVTGTDDDFNLH